MPLFDLLCPLGHEVEVQPNQIGKRCCCPTCQIVFTLNPGKAMPKLEIYCPNQHLLQVKQKYVGKKVRCPSCRTVLRVNIEALVRKTDASQFSRSSTAKPILMSSSKSLPRARPVAISVTKPSHEFPIIEAVLLEDESLEEQENTTLTSATLVKHQLETRQVTVKPRLLLRADSDAVRMGDTGLGVSLLGAAGILATLAANSLFAFLLMLILQGVSTLDGLRLVGNIAEVFNWLFFLSYFVSAVAFFIGGVISIVLPHKTGAKLWAIFQAALTLAVMATLAGLWMWERSQAAETLRVVLGDGLVDGISMHSQFMMKILIQRCGALAGWACFLSVMWQLARFIRKPRLAAKAIYVLLGGMAFTIVVLGLVWLPSVLGIGPVSQAGVWTIQIISLLIHVGGAAALIIWQSIVVGEIRSQLQRLK